MRKMVLVVAFGVLLVSLLACGGDGDSPSLTLVNDSSFTVCYVNISPSTDTEWGPDKLGSEETIETGQSRVWDLTAGTYDLRALDCDQEVLDIQEGIEIQGAITWTLTDQ